jgi:hypothetical protein
VNCRGYAGKTSISEIRKSRKIWFNDLSDNSCFVGLLCGIKKPFSQLPVIDMAMETGQKETDEALSKKDLCGASTVPLWNAWSTEKAPLFDLIRKISKFIDSFITVPLHKEHSHEAQAGSILSRDRPIRIFLRHVCGRILP